jgi:hypothetical protein
MILQVLSVVDLVMIQVSKKIFISLEVNDDCDASDADDNDDGWTVASQVMKNI